MKDEGHNVGTQLSFALYSAANRVARMQKPILKPLGLTFPQYLVILELLGKSPLMVGALGSRLDMDTGTITPLLKRLDAAGLVTRTRDPADERCVMVELTPRGRALEPQILGVTDQIKVACQPAYDDLDDLRRRLDALAQPGAD